MRVWDDVDAGSTFFPSPARIASWFPGPGFTPGASCMVFLQQVIEVAVSLFIRWQEKRGSVYCDVRRDVVSSSMATQHPGAQTCRAFCPCSKKREVLERGVSVHGQRAFVTFTSSDDDASHSVRRAFVPVLNRTPHRVSY